MGSVLTQGRPALLAALRADPEIRARVRTCVEFGPGLRRRFAVVPALCPALSVAQAGTAERRIANVECEIAQTLHVGILTAGQDAAPCEELAALVVDCVHACSADRLGLAAEGLTAVRVRAVRCKPLPDEHGPRMLWSADVEVELLWRRIP
ncbi:MAG: hypothetical protein GXY85_03290 [Candidatus Brocadiaceae bacterium]|nr:hypothetical protein [Candidatus Brocadiaceae bacterium]